MRDFVLLCSDEVREVRCERCIDIFPWPGMGVVEMASHSSVTVSTRAMNARHASELGHKRDSSPC